MHILYDFSYGGLVAKSCPTLGTPRTVAYQAVSPWDSPGKNTGVGCHFLLQGIFLTQASNPCLLHLPALAGGFFTTSTTRCCCCCYVASVVSDSVRPHRRQPTRLLRPWDSPGEKTLECHLRSPNKCICTYKKKICKEMS